MRPSHRALVGFAAGVSVLTLHQGMWALLHLAGLMPPPYPTTPTAPFGVPAIVSGCFRGGLYGAASGLLAPRPRAPMWLSGLALGLVATVVGWAVAAPLKGRPPFGGFVPMTMPRPVPVNGASGLGVGLILPPLLRRTARRSLP